jgi:basic membrane protein A and related proteins
MRLPSGCFRRRDRMLQVTGVCVLLTLAAACSSSPSTSSASAASTSTATSSSGTSTLKIGWIYYGPIDDGGWNSAMNRAEIAIGKEFPNVDNIDVTQIPNTSAVTTAGNTLVSEGATLLVDTNGYGPLFASLCAAHPSIHCLANAPEGALPNNTVGFAENLVPAEYVSGVIAGMLGDKKLGYILPGAFPSAIAALDTFELGCQSVEPSCVTSTITTNEYYNPPVEQQGAQTLADNGATILRGFLNDQAYCATAQSRGIRAIGEYSDAYSICPQAIVTSLVVNFQPFFAMEIKKILAGQFTHSNLVFSLDVGGLDFSIGKWGPNIPQAVKTKAAATLAGLADGSIYPWQGPLTNQAGKVQLQKGQRMSETYLYDGWDWYLHGVIKAS